ncbi:MAG TPA: hypothetical protein VK636_06950 [Gemmatimonadaceae bacterium]|nr:hypothetical protein [Gemmatimonadaceae bacterium]
MRVLLAAMVWCGLARAVNAQASGPAGVAQRGLIPIENRTYIGINPVGVLFQILSVEVESGVAQGMTAGGTASYIDVDNDRYTSAEFKFRYYPGEIVLRGFSLGATVGFLRYSTLSDLSRRESLDAPTIGAVADYNWMLGTQHRLVIGTGIGAKRIIAGSDDRKRVDLPRATVTGRFIVGVAF